MDSDETWWVSWLGDKNKPIKFQFRSESRSCLSQDTTCKLISLAEVCALPSVLLVNGVTNDGSSIMNLEVYRNKDKCVQEQRPKGFVFTRRTRTRRGRRKKTTKTTTSDISSCAVTSHPSWTIFVHDEKIVYLRNYNILNGITFKQ